MIEEGQDARGITKERNQFASGVNLPPGHMLVIAGKVQAPMRKISLICTGTSSAPIIAFVFRYRYTLSACFRYPCVDMAQIAVKWISELRDPWL